MLQSGGSASMQDAAEDLPHVTCKIVGRKIEQHSESLHSHSLGALSVPFHADSVLLAGGHDRGSCNGSLASLFPTKERAKEVALFEPTLPKEGSIRNSQGITLE